MSGIARRFFRASLVGALLLPVSHPSALAAAHDDDGPGIYLHLVRAAPVDLDEATWRLEDALTAAGTFGIVAGGPFVEKIETVARLETPDVEPATIADLLAEQIPTLDGDWTWGIHPVYVIDLREHGVSLLGLTGARMEADAFRIVGMFFEDAGKTAFAKNTGMPGSIEDEIESKIRAILW